MELSVSEVKIRRKRVEGLRTRRMQHGCDEVVGGSTSECVLSMSFMDEPSDEEGDNDECAAEWM